MDFAERVARLTLEEVYVMLTKAQALEAAGREILVGETMKEVGFGNWLI